MQWPAELVSASRSQRHVMDYLDQLACRTMMQLVPLQQNITETCTGTTGEIEEDILRTCERFISRRFNRSQDQPYVGTFIDAYDTLSAAVTFVFLVHHSTRISSEQKLSSSMEIIQKCSILMTVASERFTAFRAFRGCLLSMSSQLLRGNISQTHVSPQLRQMAGRYELTRLSRTIQLTKSGRLGHLNASASC